jgi:hypothetical protein
MPRSRFTGLHAGSVHAKLHAALPGGKKSNVMLWARTRLVCSKALTLCDGDLCFKILSRLLPNCIQLPSAKFGSFPVESRFRQPASPLLTGSDSSQQKIQIEKEHPWKQER